MKAIINGRIYNTETADLVCEVSHSSKSSFDWHETELYRTPNGAFFLAGEGGPRSMWAKHDGNCSSSGKGLQVITVQEARSFMEKAGCDEETYEEFGPPLVEG